MNCRESNAIEYKSKASCTFVYNKSEFAELNAYKVDAVRYLIFADTKERFGLVAGQRENSLLCPFSAPFGCFVPLKEKWELEQLEDAIKSLTDFSKNKGITTIRLTLPPAFYDENLITSVENILLRCGYEIKYQDINFHMDIRELMSGTYEEHIRHNARKNLRISQEKGLKLRRCGTEEEKNRAYQVIKENREGKGYPLRMTWDQVNETIRIVPHDFFIVSNGIEDIASAQVFHVTDRIAQVIYWGDRPGFSEYKPINFLAYELLKFYNERGFEILDIGPSTENGIPNYGLCDFKTSIGCKCSSKLTLEKVLE